MRKRIRGTNQSFDYVATAESFSCLAYVRCVGRLRVFLCGVEGERTFEDLCDDGPPPCTVDGVLCDSPTDRQTCVRPLECTAPTVVPGGRAHRMLRMRDAPRWVTLPYNGIGFTVCGNTNRATSWVADALQLAGQLYINALDPNGNTADGAADPWSQPSLAVEAAAYLDGGAFPVPHPTGYQTGNTLRIRAPPNREEVAAALVALKTAGFVTTYTADALRADSAILAFMPTPAVAAVAQIPLITSATISFETLTTTTPQCVDGSWQAAGASVGGASILAQQSLCAATGPVAVLELQGSEFGLAPSDVVAVSVGGAPCELIAHNKTFLRASCVAAHALGGSVHGFPTLATMSGGLATGCMHLDFEAASPAARRLQSSSEASADGGLFGRRLGEDVGSTFADQALLNEAFNGELVRKYISEPAAQINELVSDTKLRLNGLIAEWDEMTRKGTDELDQKKQQALQLQQQALDQKDKLQQQALDQKDKLQQQALAQYDESTQQLLKLVPPTAAAVNKLLAYGPALRTVLQSGDTTINNLQTMAVEKANLAFNTVCGWASKLNGGAEATIARLPLLLALSPNSHNFTRKAATYTEGLISRMRGDLAWLNLTLTNMTMFRLGLNQLAEGFSNFTHAAGERIRNTTLYGNTTVGNLHDQAGDFTLYGNTTVGDLYGQALHNFTERTGLANFARQISASVTHFFQKMVAFVNNTDVTPLLLAIQHGIDQLDATVVAKVEQGVQMLFTFIEDTIPTLRHLLNFTAHETMALRTWLNEELKSVTSNLIPRLSIHPQFKVDYFERNNQPYLDFLNSAAGPLFDLITGANTKASSIHELMTIEVRKLADYVRNNVDNNVPTFLNAFQDIFCLDVDFQHINFVKELDGIEEEFQQILQNSSLLNFTHNVANITEMASQLQASVIARLQGMAQSLSGSVWSAITDPLVEIVTQIDSVFDGLQLMMESLENIENVVGPASNLTNGVGMPELYLYALEAMSVVNGICATPTGPNGSVFEIEPISSLTGIYDETLGPLQALSPELTALSQPGSACLEVSSCSTRVLTLLEQSADLTEQLGSQLKTLTGLPKLVSQHLPLAAGLTALGRQMTLSFAIAQSWASTLFYNSPPEISSNESDYGCATPAHAFAPARESHLAPPPTARSANARCALRSNPLFPTFIHGGCAEIFLRAPLNITARILERNLTTDSSADDISYIIQATDYAKFAQQINDLEAANNGTKSTEIEILSLRNLGSARDLAPDWLLRLVADPNATGVHAQGLSVACGPSWAVLQVGNASVSGEPFFSRLLSDAEAAMQLGNTFSHASESAMNYANGVLENSAEALQTLLKENFQEAMDAATAYMEGMLGIGTAAQYAKNLSTTLMDVDHLVNTKMMNALTSIAGAATATCSGRRLEEENVGSDESDESTPAGSQGQAGFESEAMTAANLAGSAGLRGDGRRLQTTSATATSPAGGGQNAGTSQSLLSAPKSNSQIKDSSASTYQPNAVLDCASSPFTREEHKDGSLAEMSSNNSAVTAKTQHELSIPHLWGMPSGLLGAFKQVACFVPNAFSGLRDWLEEAMNGIAKFVTLLSLGSWGYQLPPPCKHPFCLETVSVAAPFWRNWKFPIGYLQFWDLSTKPLIDFCTGLFGSISSTQSLTRRFTIPGLMSDYSYEASAFLKQRTKYVGGGPAGIACPAYQHVLLYSPVTNWKCGASAPPSALLARTNITGGIEAVFQLKGTDGNYFKGSVTGLAVSTMHDTIWVCGSTDRGKWKILSFSHSIVASRTVDPNDPSSGDIQACSEQDISDRQELRYGDRCMLAYNEQQFKLWASVVSNPNPLCTGGVGRKGQAIRQSARQRADKYAAKAQASSQNLRTRAQASAQNLRTRAFGPASGVGPPPPGVGPDTSQVPSGPNDSQCPNNYGGSQTGNAQCGDGNNLNYAAVMWATEFAIPSTPTRPRYGPSLYRRFRRMQEEKPKGKRRYSNVTYAEFEHKMRRMSSTPLDALSGLDPNCPGALKKFALTYRTMNFGQGLISAFAFYNNIFRQPTVVVARCSPCSLERRFEPSEPV